MSSVPPPEARLRESTFARIGLAMASWSERWFPDPLAFALAGIVIVFIFGLILGESPAKLAIAGGKSFWSLGLSSSAAMLMATKTSIPPSLLAITGLIPLTQTLFLWPSIVTTAVLIVVSVTIAYLSAPSEANARTAEAMGIRYQPLQAEL